ncbi:hypothetical protein AVEN_142953-1 [Araneus ventricosus]|uniref:Uncharacterized protein n=1 Tax=Araneus ventricosus TaxID=182803 RepID=A0A4Y2M9N9_ARAVE|nr:hypothetical protein AVEN_142953-1 [Araneus ventricosus]
MRYTDILPSTCRESVIRHKRRSFDSRTECNSPNETRLLIRTLRLHRTPGDDGKSYFPFPSSTRPRMPIPAYTPRSCGGASPRLRRQSVAQAPIRQQRNFTNRIHFFSETLQVRVMFHHQVKPFQSFAFKTFHEAHQVIVHPARRASNEFPTGHRPPLGGCSNSSRINPRIACLQPIPHATAHVARNRTKLRQNPTRSFLRRHRQKEQRPSSHGSPPETQSNSSRDASRDLFRRTPFPNVPHPNKTHTNSNLHTCEPSKRVLPMKFLPETSVQY